MFWKFPCKRIVFSFLMPKTNRNESFLTHHNPLSKQNEEENNCWIIYWFIICRMFYRKKNEILIWWKSSQNLEQEMSNNANEAIFEYVNRKFRMQKKEPIENVVLYCFVFNKIFGKFFKKLPIYKNIKHVVILHRKKTLLFYFPIWMSSVCKFSLHNFNT